MYGSFLFQRVLAESDECPIVGDILWPYLYSRFVNLPFTICRIHRCRFPKQYHPHAVWAEGHCSNCTVLSPNHIYHYVSSSTLPCSCHRIHNHRIRERPGGCCMVCMDWEHGQRQHHSRSYASLLFPGSDAESYHCYHNDNQSRITMV